MSIQKVREYLAAGSKLKVIFNVFLDEDCRLYKERLGI